MWKANSTGMDNARQEFVLKNEKCPLWVKSKDEKWKKNHEKLK